MAAARKTSKRACIDFGPFVTERQPVDSREGQADEDGQT
jgi:hypothetical protein